VGFESNLRWLAVAFKKHFFFSFRFEFRGPEPQQILHSKITFFSATLVQQRVILLSGSVRMAHSSIGWPSGWSRARRRINRNRNYIETVLIQDLQNDETKNADTKDEIAMKLGYPRQKLFSIRFQRFNQ